MAERKVTLRLSANTAGLKAVQQSLRDLAGGAKGLGGALSGALEKLGSKFSDRVSSAFGTARKALARIFHEPVF